MLVHKLSRVLLPVLIACIGTGLAACIAVAPDEDGSTIKEEIEAEDIAVAEQAIYFDADLGSVMGSPVVQGDTCGAGNHFWSGCGSNGAHDRVYYWTAPSSGSFTFTTAGSSYDTVLQVMDQAQSVSLGCNDDANGTLQSSLTLNLSAGQKITLVVDGYSGWCGSFKLNISGSGSYWTPWFDRDNPSGNGDYEVTNDFINMGYPICPNPVGIQCQTLNGVDWSQTGEVYSCQVQPGGFCVNANQPDGFCLDYRVRYLCP